MNPCLGFMCIFQDYFKYVAPERHLRFAHPLNDAISDRLLEQEPLNQRTYHADDFVLAPVVVVIMH
jgi:hypothetical protein